jgi:aerobic C4-dicarboxylate transport protein
LKPLGDGFIALIKMMIAPVIFCTVVRHLLDGRSEARRTRRFEDACLFEVVSTLALAVGDR